MQENNNNITGQIHKKEIGNAISAYLMVLVSSLFLFNKNKYMNTDFVRGHIKSAILIHLGFFITYIIFMGFGLFGGINIFGLWLNHIITIIIFIFLLGMLIMGIYKAKDGLSFSVSKSINLYKQKNILDINGDGNITEKEKLTIILSFVPFVGFLLLGKYKDHETIQNSIKMNVIISLAISLLFIFGYGNLSSLLLLIYIIIITFIGINLFTRNQLLQIKLPKIFSFEEIYIMFLVLKKYLVGYVKSNSFKDFSTTYKFIVEEKIKNEIELEKQLSTKNDFPLPKPILYIPIINLISVFSKDSKYSIHKANGIILTIVMIISLTISYFGYLDYGTYILFLFPILFGIGFLNYKLAYKIPVIYDIYFMIAKFFGFIKFGTKRINEKRKEKVEVSFKVENKTKSINNIEKLYNNTETKK